MPDPQAIRTLVLSVDIGAGHRSAAEALCAAIAEQRPGSSHELVDALEYLGPDQGVLTKEMYFGLLKDAPDLWGAAYQQRGLVELFRPMGEFLDGLRATGLERRLRQYRPQLILAMHPIACGLAAALVRSGHATCPAVAVLTDFDAHPAWVARGLDHYLVATEAMAAAMQGYGAEADALTVSGIPLRPGFAKIRKRVEASRELGLDPQRTTLLLLGGGLGLGPIAETAQTLATLQAPMQLVVIAGSNADLERRARNLAADAAIPVQVTGRVDKMWDYMAAADLAVGKSGGLSCAELLAAGVPLIALAPIPGQEQANSDALVKAGAARPAETPDLACQAVAELLEDPEQLQRMGEAARQLGKPAAAQVAATRVLELVDRTAQVRARRASREGGAFSLSSEAFKMVDAAASAIEELETSLGLSPAQTVDRGRDPQRSVEDTVEDALQAMKKKLGL